MTESIEIHATGWGQPRAKRSARAARGGNRRKRPDPESGTTTASTPTKRRDRRAAALAGAEDQERMTLPALGEDVDTDAATPWFTEATEAWGLDFVHEAGDTSAFHLPQITGSGSALFDYDGDLDLYLLHGGPDPGRPSEREGLSNQLFANEPTEHGDAGRAFREVPGAAGLTGSSYGQGVAVGDFDNDGFEDVFLSNWGFDQLYHNDAGQRFEEITARAGVANTRRIDGMRRPASGHGVP